MADPQVIVEKYIAYRDKLDAMKKEFEAQCAPYNKAMAVLEATMGTMLGDAQSIKFTGIGTAYRSETLSVKVADRNALFACVKEHDYFDLLAASVAKDAVKQYMEDHGGNPPPGVDVVKIHKVNFRRG